MKTRSLEPELLDAETPPEPERARVAGYLAFVNRWLGGTASVDFHLRDVAGPAVVLDVAAGAGDMARDLHRRHPHLTCVAFDLSDWMLALGPGLPRIRGDVRRFPFRDQLRGLRAVTGTHGRRALR